MPTPPWRPPKRKSRCSKRRPGRRLIDALGVLLARPPEDLLEELSPVGDIPGVPARIPAGLPSDLLRRRPDIREAEAQLHAATAQIGVATADLFPQFSLTGSVGWQSSQFASWWSVVNRSYSFGPSVEWPIFQGGAIVSNIHVQEALRDQAFINYRQTVLGAFQDVENGLVAFTREQEHYKSLKDSVAANSKAVRPFGKALHRGAARFFDCSGRAALAQRRGRLACPKPGANWTRPGFTVQSPWRRVGSG